MVWIVACAAVRGPQCKLIVSEGGGLQKLMGSAVGGCSIPCLPGLKWGRKERENSVGFSLSVPVWTSCKEGGNEVSSFVGSHVSGGHLLHTRTHGQWWASISFYLFLFWDFFLTCLLGILSLPLGNILLPEQWLSGKSALTGWTFSLWTATVAWCLHGFVLIDWRSKSTGNRSTSSAIIVLKKSGAVVRFYSFTSCVWGDRWSRPKETDLQREINAFLSLTWKNWNSPATFVVKPKVDVCVKVYESIKKTWMKDTFWGISGSYTQVRFHFSIDWTIL